VFRHEGGGVGKERGFDNFQDMVVGSADGYEARPVRWVAEKCAAGVIPGSGERRKKADGSDAVRQFQGGDGQFCLGRLGSIEINGRGGNLVVANR
jgi:hypothetical protein